MLTVEIPGHRRLALDHLALDLRHAGSACGATVPDGEILPGVAACTATVVNGWRPCRLACRYTC